MGVAYFHGLARHFDGPGQREKLAMLAEVERAAAESVRPLLDKHGLVARQAGVLKLLGEAGVEKHRDQKWMDFMRHMARTYPGYVAQFEALSRLAPVDDLPALQRLTDHETAAIDFAEKEVAGDADSLAPLREYLR